MNVYAFIISLVLVFEFLIDLIADLLNIRSLKLPIPSELQGVYDSEAYRKSQEYTRANTRFSNITGTFHLVILLIFWFLGGFNLLDQVVRSWGLITPVAGVLYLGIIMFAYSLLTLPFEIYDTFVIEERFGFNKTTPRTFIMDHLKALGLSIILGVPLTLGIISLFEYAGEYAWVFCWILVTIISLVVEFIFPTWILPLFNKFIPIEEGELKTAIMNYANSVKFSIKNVFVMDGSKRSTKSNAFFTGFGNNKRIALFDTFINKHTIPEIVAVLAHEIGHYKKKHIPQGMIIGILHTGAVLFLLSIFLRAQGLYDAFFMQQQSIYAGFLFFGLLYTPIEMLLSIGMNMLSRKNEYEADKYAATTVKQPQVMIDALKKLSSHNLSNLTPHSFYTFMHYSHPALLQRIRAIQEYVAK
jgi:STE24 endopeptidase